MPLETPRRREQWFRERRTIEFGAEIDDQQALVRGSVSKEPEHECMRGEDSTVDLTASLRLERRLVSSQPQ